MIPTPRLAATVILLRPAEQRGFEVFLTRRPEDMRFLGGMYCFPGGILRKEDSCDAMVRRTAGLTPHRARQILGAQFAPKEALGLWVAAIRELFEEVGILLTVDKAKNRTIMDSVMKARLAEKHAALLGNSLSFQTCLESESLFCDASALGYFSHWQTPPEESMRFDTHFFLTASPADQFPLPTSPEVIHSLWLTPDRGLQMFGKGQLPMIFPTFASLRTLADFDSIDSVWKEFGVRQ